MKTTQEIKLVIVPICGKLEYACGFIPSTNEILFCPQNRGKPYLIKRTITEVIQEALSYGTHNFNIFISLVEQVPEFRQIWNELLSTFNTLFTEGEEVILWHNGSPELHITGAIVGWQKVCDYTTNTNKIICYRNFTSLNRYKTNAIQLPQQEQMYEKIDLLNEWKTGKKIVSKVKKELKNEGCIGIIMRYQNKNYKI